ncbi:AMP-binding protein [Pseudomaricurvus alkylphenolicus]|uniref:AMP-binding protein n=1 Tax=Pseudomaricurvus alkylphenolicus TaxID=1306991 RepID=UPI00141EC657|nr:AMP-binding protein [Pseudomaricurvus alkylphenolicus]NIB43092.1 AMP-binding protein [Pseudomaricurvus alkylphenolicus]
MKNIAEMLRWRALQTPDKAAVKFLQTELTWKEVYQQAFELSQRLGDAGVRRGDVVGIYLDHSLGQVISIFAIALRDAVFTIVNPQLVHDQVKHQVQDASMTAILGSDEMLRPLQDFFANRMMHVEYISSAGLEVRDGENPVDLTVDTTGNIPADVSNYIYTSGSTGLAKGVVVPHRTLLDGARIVSQYLKINAEDNILSILPFSFDYGLNQLMSAVHAGAKITLHHFIFPKELVEILQSEEITALAVVPSVWPKILKPKLLGNVTFPRLRYITTAGGFHSPELLHDASSYFPNTEIIVMYGLTESFRSTYLPFSEIFNRPGSIGRAVPEVEILVLNEQGQPCAPGEKGELVHRGAFVTYGYLNNAELNEKKFIRLNHSNESRLPELAVRSGDQVSLDKDGFIYFHGRMDQQIKSSGFRISPDEVAQAVLTTPGIGQAVVFGMPDKALGEAIHVAYESFNNEPVDILEIKRHAKNSLATYAIPHHYHYYPQIPLNHNGKTDFTRLKNNVIAQAASREGQDKRSHGR